MMKTDLVLKVTLSVDLSDPSIKEGYDKRIAKGQTHKEIIDGFNEILTEAFIQLMQEEFDEDGMTCNVETL